eukprot:525884-Alexandrium_andersonii.AAC.1
MRWHALSRMPSTVTPGLGAVTTPLTTCRCHFGDLARSTLHEASVFLLAQLVRPPTGCGSPGCFTGNTPLLPLHSHCA